MTKTCIVDYCYNRASRDNVRFYRIPAVRTRCFYPHFAALSYTRRQLWLEAIGRDDLSETTIKNARVCSIHFISGKPSSLLDDEDPDWVPSLYMKYTSKHPRPDQVLYVQLKEFNTEVPLKNSHRYVSPDTNMNLNNIEIEGVESLTDSISDPAAPNSPNSQSLLDTLRDIQQNNPQIETVFEEEDEPKQSTKTPFDDDVQFVQEIKPKMPAAPILKEYIRVKAMSPAQMGPNLLQQGHTIVLQDATKNAKLTKFLVIPKEVIPILARSKGPLAINVPGIGPLIIPKPAEILCPRSSVHKSTTTVLPPILPVKIKPEVPSVPRVPIYQPLKDHKFSCWLYRSNLKRDLNGFTITDRLGFYRSEQERCKSCVTKMAGLISNLEKSIAESKKKLVDIRYKNRSFKLVDIRSITANQPAESKKFMKKKSITPKNPEQLSEVQEKNLKAIMSWKEHFLESRYSSTDSDEELLVTKRVVTLRPRGRRKPNFNPKYISETQVTTLRGRGSRGRRRGGRMGPNTSQRTDEYTPRPRGRPRKRGRGRGRWQTPRFQETFYEDPLVLALKETQFCIIDNLKEFQKVLNPNIPLLVVNKEQCAKMDLTELLEKNNIVFPLTRHSDISDSLGSSEEMKRIKFVTPDVLGRYLSGATE